MLLNIFNVFEQAFSVPFVRSKTVILDKTDKRNRQNINMPTILMFSRTEK